MRCIIKKLPLIIVLAALSFAANATSVTYTFTGSWEAMNTWNPGQTGDNTLSATPEGGPQMAVEGLITFDDGSGIVTGLTMNQASTLTSNWDYNSDYPNTPEFGTVTMSNFAWTSNGTDLRLDSGIVVCDSGANVTCGPGMEFGGNYVGRGGPLETFGPPASLTDWIGASNFDAYGDILDGPGFEGMVLGGSTATINTLTSWNGFVALAATSRYDLQLGTQVPVPAAVWLFGSGLGLLGWMRRRVSQ